MKLIKCENVTLKYENHVVCRNLSFEVENGDFLCVVGENGSGKSTLVKAILSLKSVYEGRLDLMCADGVGYLPQQTTVQRDFPASAFEVVLSGCIGSKKGAFFSKKLKATAVENMKRLNVYELRRRCYRELSGGQQQRLLLARALCAAKELLLLDEPVSGLDPAATSEFYSLIEKINRELGMTIVMVSHDICYAAHHARHILHMKKDGAEFMTAEQYRLTPEFLRLHGGACND